MAKLTKKQGKAIAELINSLQCADLMQRNAMQEGNSEKFTRWYRQECEATVALADDHGINLPNLQRHRDWLDVAWLATQRDMPQPAPVRQ